MAAVQAVQAAMEGISRLEKYLNYFNDEYVQLVTESDRIIHPKGGEENKKIREENRQSLTSWLETWNFCAQSFTKGTVRPKLLSHLSSAYKTLDLHHRFLTLNLDSRLQSLTAKINDEQELHKEEPDLERTILVKMVATIMDLLIEARRDLEDEAKEENAAGNRKTLSLWLKENEKDPRMTSEWQSLFDLRAMAVLAAFKLSKLLVRFTFSLSGNEKEKLNSLVSRIKKFGDLTPEKRNVANNIVSAIDTTGSMMKQRKVEEIERVEIEDVLEKVVSQFCEAILDLEFLLSGACVPDTWKMVREARVKLEVVLGQILCNVQGIKLTVNCLHNKNRYNNADWKATKEFIGDMWEIGKLCGGNKNK